MIYPYLLLIFTLLSCESPEGIKKIHSLPTVDKGSEEAEGIRLTIVATTFFKENTPFQNDKGMAFGGEKALKKYMSIMREELRDELILLNAGHIKELGNGPVLRKDLKLLSDLSYDGINLTKNELLFFFSNREGFEQSDLAFFNNNMIDLKTGKSLETSSITSSLILDRKGIKLGIIGINDYSQLTPSTKEKITGIVFNDPVQSILRAKNNLKKKKVDLIILVVDDTDSCKMVSPFALEMEEELDYKEMQIDCTQSKSFLGKVLKRLPKNIIDLIITGDGGNSYAFFGKTPIIQAPKSDRYFSLTQIVLDKETKKIDLKKSRFIPTIKTCHNFYLATMDCHIEKKSKELIKYRSDILEESEFKISPAFFLNKRIIL